MEPGIYRGMHQPEYRSADGVANSELLLFKRNPSTYIWSKTAPTDPAKTGTADIGNALHMLWLEPENFDDNVIVADVKGRQTNRFSELVEQNPDKIILTEQEVSQVKVMFESSLCDPMFKRIIEAKGDCESSIFVDDPNLGIRLKIRPDKVINTKAGILMCDMKTTSSIDEWRSNREWINPLFKLNYGITAAYYLYVGSIHYGVELTEYAFPIAQKSIELGRYPVSVFTITKRDLEAIGFWAEMMINLEAFAEAYKANNFVSFERFPVFK